MNNQEKWAKKKSLILVCLAKEDTKKNGENFFKAWIYVYYLSLVNDHFEYAQAYVMSKLCKKKKINPYIFDSFSQRAVMVG